MRCGVWVAVALFAAACQPSSLGPAAPAQNVWVTADAAGHDAQPRDAAVRHDAAPLDAVRHDAAPVERGLPDAPAHDAATADGGTQTCGSLHLVCTPYLCDVDAGQCRSTCNGPADCTNGRACVNHTCQVDDLTACTTNSECLTDFCVDGVCCNSACAGACRTCTLPGAIGTCSQVPAGAVDPRQICAAGSSCNASGACLPSSCALDQDCGELALCANGACHTCDATCASDADCDVGSACFHRNGCSYCDPRNDAGADAH